MPKPQDDPWKWRKCRFCKLPFKPTGKDVGNARRQQFCTAAHQKEYWKRGALPADKFTARIEKQLEKRMREILREQLPGLMLSYLEEHGIPVPGATRLQPPHGT